MPLIARDETGWFDGKLDDYSDCDMNDADYYDWFDLFSQTLYSLTNQQRLNNSVNHILALFSSLYVCNNNAFDVCFVSLDLSDDLSENKTNKSYNADWMLDSGATTHLTHRIEDFIEYKPFDKPQGLWTQNGFHKSLLGIGTVVIKHTVHNQTKLTKLHDVKYNAMGQHRLLSMFYFVDELKCSLHSENENFIVYDVENQAPLLEATPMRPGARLRSVKSVVWDTDETAMLSQQQNLDYEIWHNRFAHANKNVIRHLSANVNNVDTIIIPTNESLCKGCALGKAISKTYPLSEKRASQPLELIHSDLCEFPTLSYNKYKYMINFLDDYSSYAWTKLLRNKSDAFEAFMEYYPKAEKRTGKKLITLRTDRGGEFISERFNEFLNKEGIELETSAPYIHQQNGKAERLNRTLIEKSEALRHYSGLPEVYWQFSVETASFVYNCTPMGRLNWKTPAELWNGKQPDASYFRTFGCGAYVWLPDEIRQNKLSPKAEEMIFLGYDKGSKAYHFLCKNNTIFIGTHAFFNEKWFP